MNNVNVFSDLSWGDLTRYKIKNDAVIRERRATKLDQRIRTVNNKPRTIEWAYETIEFCNRENTQNKDIFSISKESFRLNELENEAKLFIKNENERIEAEKKSLAANIDATIVSLTNAPRGEYWCREVKSLDADIQQNVSRDVRTMLKNLNQLHELVQEANLLIEASNVDKTIRSLMNCDRKDRAWMDSVDSLTKAITPNIRPLLKETTLYENLQKEYLRVQRQPIYSVYEICLKQIESGKLSQKKERDDFDLLDRELTSYNYSMQKYIADFNSRWSKARALVESEKRRLIEEEETRIQAELTAERRRAEEAYLALIARRAKERKEKIVHNVMLVLACLFGYVVCSLIMYVGFEWALNLGNKFYTLFVVIACSLFTFRIFTPKGIFKPKYYGYSAGSIVGQIILYLDVIIFSWLLGYGIFNMIICCFAVACITNACAFEIGGSSPLIRFFQALCSVFTVIGMILGMEYWLPGMVTQNPWHALWVLPVLIIAIMTASAFNFYDYDNLSATAIIISFIFAIAMTARSILIIDDITDGGQGLGMFFLGVLLFVVLVIVYIAGIHMMGIIMYRDLEWYDMI